MILPMITAFCHPDEERAARWKIQATDPTAEVVAHPWIKSGEVILCSQPFPPQWVAQRRIMEQAESMSLADLMAANAWMQLTYRLPMTRSTF